MKKNYLLSIVLLFACTIKAQQPLYSWAHSIGNTNTQRNSVDYTKRIYVDNAGDVYLTGSFNGTIDFDPSAATFTMSSASGWDIFLAKYTSAGGFLWAKKMGGTGGDESLAIGADASSNIYITGHFNGTSDFDPGPGVFNLSSGGTSMYFAKYDAAGNFVYAKLISGNGGIYPQSILLDASNNIYVAGYVTGGYDFDPGPGSAPGGGAAGSTASFICKYDNAGNYIFNDNFFPTGSSLREFVIYNMDIDASKNIYVAGAFSGTIDMDPSVSGTVSVNSGSGAFKEDAFLAKYDSTGNYVWGKNFACDGLAFSVSTDPFGNVLFTGYYNALFDLDPGPGIYTVPTATNSCFVGKYSSAGNFILGFNIPGINMAPSFNGLKTNSLGDFYIVGGFSGTNVDFDPGPGTSFLTSTCQDMFVTKYNASGNFLWCNKIGCGMFNGLWSHVGALFLRNSSLYLSGVFIGTGVDFDPGPGTANLSSGSGVCNILLAKYNDCSATIPSSPGVISGTNQICQGTTAIYSVSTVTNATSYNWSLPGGWSGSSSSNTISITSGSLTGNISVTASNACGTSTASVLNVTVNALPSVSVTGNNTVCSGSSLTLTASGASTYTWNTSATTVSITVSPTINTTYTLTGTSASGCSKAATKSVTIIALPTVSINSISNSVCLGNSLTLSGSGASTYTWNTSATTISISVSPTTNTTYTVTGTSAATGCRNMTIKTISVNPLPTVSISGNNSVCNGNNIVLSASGANTYTWNTSATTGSISVSPTVSTTYSVNGTDINGCINSAVKTITINPSPTISVSGGAICPGGTFTLNPTGALTYTYSSGSAAVSPTSTTSYSVTGTSSLGCISSTPAVATVSVSNILTVSITGSNSICSGQPITLTGNGATTYSWSTGATTTTIAPTPSTNTTYTLIGSSGSCSNIAVKSITVNPLPSITISGSTVMCTGETATLIANGAITYTWSNSAIGNTITISPTITTNYSVTGADNNNCSDVATTTMSVSPCIGINELSDDENTIAIYPNPTSGYLTIKSQHIDVNNIRIFNLLSEEIFHFIPSINGSNIEVNLNHLPNGIYIIRIGQYSKKIVKE